MEESEGINRSTVIQQGFAEVPGGRLRYRLCGVQTDIPTLVFENGWGASYQYWAWIEEILSPHAQLLFYNRAGIGGSQLDGKQSAAGLSIQFSSMLDRLGIETPPVVVGHSYGGIMCSLHAAQNPNRVSGIVQLDPTPDTPEVLNDQALETLPVVAKVSIGLARLGIANPLFKPVSSQLPLREGHALLKESFSSASSLRAALNEFYLLADIRSEIRKGRAKTAHPRLVVSAGDEHVPRGQKLAGLLTNQRKHKAMLQALKEQHRQQANAHGGEWTESPYQHGLMVFEKDGARDSAERILGFVRRLPRVVRIG